MLFVSRSSEHLHAYGMAGGDVVIQERVDAVADRASGVAEELDPRRGVDEDHPALPARISSRSPFHPTPRRPRASSRLSDSPARRRSAKLTASRFVGEVVALHHSRAGFLVDIDVCAGHTPTIHQS